MTVALGDGVGAPGRLSDGTDVAEALSAAAAEVGGVRLILGWLPQECSGIDPGSFAEIVVMMPGWGVRKLLAHPSVKFLPTRLGALTGLLAGPCRPDVLITRLAPRDDGFGFATEVSWQQGVVESGARVVAVLDEARVAGGGVIDRDRVEVLGTAGDRPEVVTERAPSREHNALADNVLKWIPDGARLQYGPGQLGTALLRRAEVGLQIDTGLLTPAVLDLQGRGLLRGVPSTTYLLGDDDLYDWAAGREVLHGIEFTHDLGRLSHGDPLFAVNTAVEIDPVGQINVEGVGDNVFGGIGGHPDYCTGARLNPRGLSIIAVPHRFRGNSPLVPALTRPVSTLAHDVDVVVTEHGHADLRDASWEERALRLRTLFDG
ncbi:acetyl-CoA hydrolase/transferase C-terminal domain-containing protein [Gordonia hydrophobica]|uniref:Acetyl-CoA hydrolase/transferase C-terminal domain-containing protein n=2 Tax=Gordonia hydrophobica TaxID=40516 RepID=A0ABZ2U7E1_9ACTN|nr:acetyl-CoA hydrolase/transferase C-terminal domain-containing protein [Gordonia hydrophobica]